MIKISRYVTDSFEIRRVFQLKKLLIMAECIDHIDKSGENFPYLIRYQKNLISLISLADRIVFKFGMMIQ